MSVFSYVIADKSRSFRCIAEFIQSRLEDDSRVKASCYHKARNLLCENKKRAEALREEKAREDAAKDPAAMYLTKMRFVELLNRESARQQSNTRYTLAPRD